MLTFLLAFVLHVSLVVAQAVTNWTASPFNPPALPIAVKSPYVNAWAPLGSGGAAPFDCCSAPATTAWPRSWDTLQSILGWYISCRVDGSAYRLQGADTIPNVTDAVQKAFIFTPTRTSYLMQAGPVNINMSFLSPVEPSDLARQSMPFSYLYITAESNDGGSHSVQVFTDVTGEFITGDSSFESNYTINESGNFVYLQMDLITPMAYTEITNRPEDATLYLSMQKSDKVTWQFGDAGSIRRAYANGTITGLSKTGVDGSSPISPYFIDPAFAYDFGIVTSTTEQAVFALGVVRDPVVQFTNSNLEIEKRSAYYWANFSNIHDVVEDVLDHFDDALTGAINLDSQLASSAGQVSSSYPDILSLATRQAWGGLEYTLNKQNGAFNLSDVKAFMKDMGSVGSGGVNPVDVIYAAMPVYLYFNPAILGYLISPLLEYQQSSQYTNPYAAEDIGRAFPNATGNPNGHDQKIEQSANMIIMSLAHAQGSGDGNLLAQHYNLLKGWADYLVNNTMRPDDQSSSISDGMIGANQTNVVLKGLIGIGAMAKISQYMKKTADQDLFNSTAMQYTQQWITLASASDQLVISFGSGSSGLIYNLYADKLLQLGLINSSIYDLQTSYYGKQVALSKYGIPLDNSNPSSPSRSDWMMFAASSVTNNSVRDAMITQVRSYAAANQQNKPFAVLYQPNNGSQISGINSPAQGAMFAPLALSMGLRTVTFSNAPNIASANKSASNVAAIAGGAAGGVAFIIIVVGGLLLYRRRRKRIIESHNRSEKIERMKPGLYPPDSVSEPLRGTRLNSGSYTLQNSNSDYFSSDRVPPHSPAGPFRIRNMTENDFSGSDVSTAEALFSRSSGVGGTSGGTSSWSGPRTITNPLLAKSQVHHRELRSEVKDLRRAIERMREERVVLGEAPPSYHDGVAFGMPDPHAR